MQSTRLRLLGPLWLFGFLPAMGAAKMMGQPLAWFFGETGVLLGGGVFLAAYLISGWVLNPAKAAMDGTCRLLKGLPPEHETSTWLPDTFFKVRTEINLLFAKQHQALASAEEHTSQTAQRLQHAERMVREAFSAMQGLFAASDEGMAVIDARGSIIASNEKLDALLGEPIERLVGRDGKRLTELFKQRLVSKQDKEAWFNELATSPSERRQIAGEMPLNPPVPVELQSLPMISESGATIGQIWILRDHSKVALLERQLRESQKMGTLGLITGGIAHDFNNLLTAIHGNIALAEMTPQGNEAEVKTRLEGASQATSRATELVKQLLGYSRRGSQEKKSTDMRQVINDVQGLLRHSVDPRIVIRTKAPDAAANISGNCTQIEQVLLNLGINARDALPEKGGVIEFEVENTHRPDTSNPDAEPSPFVVISVRDNGSGISPENRQRIFEAFFTTKEPGKGTGLGLATAQEIVQDHGGWIEFDSEVGRGTEFRIFIPRLVGAIKNESVATNGSNAISLRNTAAPNKRSILVVDDEAPVRNIAVNMLKFLGYDVVEASDGQQALDMISAGEVTIDAVLLDIYMPKLSGRDTFRKLREEGNELPVIVCSGFIIDPDEFIVLSQGRTPPVDIMTKPYSLTVLQNAISKAFPNDVPLKKLALKETSQPSLIA
jgi:two-component system, cell cycle sensor histidine kinase and response regulator CckA